MWWWRHNVNLAGRMSSYTRHCFPPYLVQYRTLHDTLFHCVFMLVFPSLLLLPIAVARGLRRGSAAARLLGLRVRIPPGPWMSVSYECCVLSGREVSASGWSLVQRSHTECDREASTMKRPWPIRRLLCHKTKPAGIIDFLENLFGPDCWNSQE